MEAESISLIDRLNDINDLIGDKVIGSRRIVRFMFISLLTGNHILLEGVPGLAKTMLADEFSKHLGVEFKRIQFTPDMLPSDITGNMVYNLELKKMEFRKGPVFANIILADEINRTPPKVQSALLEAMEERHVSVYGVTYPLPRPFFVIATQNPVEQEGTFPLAEALMDRFLFRYFLTYPSQDDELKILESTSRNNNLEYYKLGADNIEFLKNEVKNVYASHDIMEYIVNIIRQTRENSMVYLGASPRTAVKYLSAVKANALISGRNYVIPEDVIYMAHEIFNHRLILRPESLIDGENNYQDILFRVIDNILSSVEVPR
ncbi:MULTISPECIES: MoxR family ATPase [Acidiplasma]|jgi:MoxR-like ATPase|uniref:Magnesium chelatase n=2 Tax=Acidiplasma TaxID=507753 RepID=A0A0Q0RP62_9ARCH|nr:MULTISPECIES: MoxR family ATPase [Acidiplasma]KJE49664.1 magnesium chelatase [Acidiplasma sp. MBA-1]KPV47328.1 magnesium chelatase [Acidiplasma aeolicum]KQB33454.1 magnesium chelatase [Acidiplasma aeolicum]KQB33949.1 magnesium chelatase [Acidiplasma cupricumulans]WMT55774.1 MAG: MoxR family ATPase [Acidiplasma sp.]